jgi:hypothetical protein
MKRTNSAAVTGNMGETWGNMGKHGETWGQTGRFQSILSETVAELADGWPGFLAVREGAPSSVFEGGSWAWVLSSRSANP